MRGYPKTIGCVRDLENLANDFPLEVKRDLERIKAHDAAHATVTRVISGSEEAKNLVTEVIPNPATNKARLGIRDAKALDDMIDAVSGTIADKEVDDGK